MSEYDDAVQALREMEANPEEARSSLGAEYESVLSRVKGIVASGATKTQRPDIEDGQIRGGPPLIQLPGGGTGQEGLPLEVPEGTVSSAEIPSYMPAARTDNQVIRDEAKVQAVYDEQYDKSLPTLSKLRELGRPAEYAGEGRPDTGATMGQATGISAPPGVGVLGSVGPGIAASRPIRWMEPSLEEFREDMRGTGWNVDVLDQNSDEYKVYADKQYAKAYDDAVKRGVPIQRSAFTEFAQTYPTAAGAAESAMAAGYGAEQVLDLGAASRMKELAYPEEALERERTTAAHPWATFGGALGAALLPAAPATAAGVMAAEKATRTAERVGFGPFGRRMIGGAVGGAAAGATQAAGEEAVGAVTGGPIDARRAIERTLSAGALGGGLGGGLGALGYGMSAWNAALRRAPKGAGVGADLTRAERYLNEGKPLTGGVVGLKTPDQLKALRVQAQQQGLPSAQTVVESEVSGPMLSEAQKLSAARDEALTLAERKVVEEADALGREAEANINELEDRIHFWARRNQEAVQKQVHEEQEAFYGQPLERQSLRPVIDVVRRLVKERTNIPSGQALGSPQLLQRWGPKMAQGVYVPEGMRPAKVREPWKLDDKGQPRSDLDIPGSFVVSAAEAKAMGFNPDQLLSEQVKTHWAGFQNYQPRAGDRVILIPFKLSAREHNQVSGDMAKEFTARNLEYQPQFSQVKSAMVSLQNRWGPNYAQMMGRHSDALGAIDRDVERAGIPAPMTETPEVSTQQRLRGVIEGYGAEGRDARVDQALERFSGASKPLLRRNLQILGTLKEAGIPVGAKPTARTSWTPGQRSTVRRILETYGVSNPPEQDAALRELLGAMEEQVTIARNLETRLGSVGLPASVPESPSDKALEGFRGKIASYDPGLRTVRPEMAELETLASEAGVEERLNLLGGISAFDRLQAGRKTIRPWVHAGPRGVGTTGVAQPGFLTLQADAWRRGISNIPPGTPGTMAGRDERWRVARPLTPDEKLELQRMVRPGAM